MFKRIFAVLLLFTVIASCHSKKDTRNQKTSVQPDQFFDAFPALHVPYFAYDTAMDKHTDAALISVSALSDFVPDSIIHKITDGSSSTSLHPVGRIDLNGNRFLIVAARRSSQLLWFVLAFTAQNKYQSYLPVLENKKGDGYHYMLGINQEPTFTIGREKKDAKGHSLYTNKGYGFSRSAKRFTLVITDTNENLPDQDDIYNPIDTLPRTFPFSGDYRKDKKNVLFLRDGKRSSEYNFFLHFDKTDEDPNCKGEMKGTIKMVGTNAAIYQQGGDPCVINFEMTNNSVKIKEQGNCANHRGSNFPFNDRFDKMASAHKDHTQKK